MQAVIPGNNRYFMAMIDGYSRYAKVFLLNKQSEVTAKIKECVSYVKTQFGKSPKKIRSDRGGEYISNELQEFLKHDGMEVEMICPYLPQQNGRANRKIII